MYMEGKQASLIYEYFMTYIHSQEYKQILGRMFIGKIYSITHCNIHCNIHH